MTKFRNDRLELSMNSLLLKREIGRRLRFDGLLRLKQREDSKIIWNIVAMECRWNAEFSLLKR